MKMTFNLLMFAFTIMVANLSHANSEVIEATPELCRNLALSIEPEIHYMVYSYINGSSEPAESNHDPFKITLKEKNIENNQDTTILSTDIRIKIKMTDCNMTLSDGTATLTGQITHIANHNDISNFGFITHFEINTERTQLTINSIYMKSGQAVSNTISLRDLLKLQFKN